MCENCEQDKKKNNNHLSGLRRLSSKSCLCLSSLLTVGHICLCCCIFSSSSRDRAPDAHPPPVPCTYKHRSQYNARNINSWPSIPNYIILTIFLCLFLCSSTLQALTWRFNWIHGNQIIWNIQCINVFCQCFLFYLRNLLSPCDLFHTTLCSHTLTLSPWRRCLWWSRPVGWPETPALGGAAAPSAAEWTTSASLQDKRQNFNGSYNHVPQGKDSLLK